MNKFKNGREAKELDQVVGTVSGRVIAGSLQINPDEKKPGTGFVHVQEYGSPEKTFTHVVCHEVTLTECFHAEDALLTVEAATPVKQTAE